MPARGGAERDLTSSHYFSEALVGDTGTGAERSKCDVGPHFTVVSLSIVVGAARAHALALAAINGKVTEKERDLGVREMAHPVESTCCPCRGPMLGP